MKKIIAFLLVLACLMGLASAAFTDKSKIGATYAEAVEVMVAEVAEAVVAVN